MIYIVASGSYSDYHIVAVFETKKLAKEFISSFGKDLRDFYLEEYSLNKVDLQRKKPFQVSIRKDGEITSVKLGTCPNDNFSDVLNANTYFYVDIEYKRKYGTELDYYMACFCFAKNEEHAIKIANEKRIQHIANNTWKSF